MYVGEGLILQVVGLFTVETLMDFIRFLSNLIYIPKVKGKMIVIAENYAKITNDILICSYRNCEEGSSRLLSVVSHLYSVILKITCCNVSKNFSSRKYP